jgi:hypothetical protein
VPAVQDVRKRPVLLCEQRYTLSVVWPAGPAATEPAQALA